MPLPLLLSEVHLCPEVLATLPIRSCDVRVGMYIFVANHPCLIDQVAPTKHACTDMLLLSGIDVFSGERLQTRTYLGKMRDSFVPTYYEYRVMSITVDQDAWTINVVDANTVKRTFLLGASNPMRQALLDSLFLYREVYVRVIYAPWSLEDGTVRARMQIESHRVVARPDASDDVHPSELHLDHASPDLKSLILCVPDVCNDSIREIVVDATANADDHLVVAIDGCDDSSGGGGGDDGGEVYTMTYWS